MNTGSSGKVSEVLVVEDNSGDLMLIKQTLESTPYPIRVHIATDGEQALQWLESGLIQPRLIILDLNLPKVPGLFFLLRRKTDAPVVVFTSSSNSREQQRALELGAREVILKPTDLAAYRERVIQMVRNWVQPNSASATCG